MNNIDLSEVVGKLEEAATDRLPTFDLPIPFLRRARWSIN